MKAKKIVLLLSAIGIMGTGILVSCSKVASSTATSGGSASSSYNGLGSKWSASFDSSAMTFQLTYDTSGTGEPDGTIDMTVDGTYEEYSNRVRHMTVTSATGTNAPSPGDDAYGIEIPGFAFFLKPNGNNSEPIVMLQSGACPTAAFSANWAKASFVDQPTDTSDSFGGASFAESGGTFNASIHQYAFGDGSDLGEHQGPVGNCVDGQLEFDDGGGGTAVMYMTQNGGALVKTPGGIIFAAPKSVGVGLADLDGDYTAIVFTGDKSVGATIFLGKISFSAGAGTGAAITDPATDATNATNAPSFALSSIGNGIFTGTMHNNTGDHPLNCIYSTVDSEKILACNGAGNAADGSGVYTKTFFMLGVKR